MHANIQLAIAGLAAGTLAALLASGLIIKFRCSRVLDLSHGAVATLGAYMFIWATNEMGWPKWVAVVVGIACAAIASALFELFIIWPARAMPTTTKLVASLGLMLLITAALPSLFGRPVDTVDLISGDPIGLGFGHPEFMLGRSSALVVVATLVLTAALSAAYKFTQFGRASVAVSDNQRMVALLGYSSRRIEFFNWMLGGALAGVAGILFATLSPATSTSLTEVLMSALAIALLIGFRSFGGMLIIGMLVGVAQAIFVRYGYDLQSATHLTGWGEAVPLVLIMAAMLARGRTVAPKGQGSERPLPDAPVARFPLRNGAIVLVVGAAWLWLIPGGWVDASTETLIMTIAALSLVVVAGYTGQISLAQLTLAGFGGFAAAKTAASWDLGFPLPILIGGLAAVPFALVIGVAAVRVRGTSLAVATLAFAIVSDDMFFNSDLTGASAGLSVPPMSAFGISFNSLGHERALGGLVLFVAVLVSVAVMYLRRSSLGLRMLAIRANERGAAASGVPVARTKLVGFVIGGAIAGVAGALEAYREAQVSWTAFGFMNSILLLAFAFLAGTTYITGAWVTGVIVNGGLVSLWLTFQGNSEIALNVFAGFTVMVIVLVHPSGLGHDLKHLVPLAASGYRKVIARAGGKGMSPPAAEPDLPATAQASAEPGMEPAQVESRAAAPLATEEQRR